MLIGLEGIDASGKTTISKLLEEKLISKGINAKRVLKKFTNYEDIRIKEHTEIIKELIWGDKNNDPYQFVTSKGWLFKHALWYSILSENYIKPNLLKHDVLIVDGWFYKIYSRFLLKEDFSRSLLAEIFNSVDKCDQVYMLKPEIEDCWNRRENFRITEMGGYDFTVSDPKKSYIEYQSKVANILENIAKKEQWEIIQTKQYSAEETADILVDMIINKLESRKLVWKTS